jgi:hypothetical protein
MKKRITQISVSMMATLAVAAAVAAPASAYESVNAASNPVSSADDRSSAGGTSVNAILSESRSVAGERVYVSTPNAILGSRNVGDSVAQTPTSSGSTGFDWSDALIGAAGALVLVLFTGGAMVLVRHRRGPRVQPTV